MTSQAIENRDSSFTPGSLVPIVRQNPQTHQRELVHLHWGFIPAWADSPAIGGLTHARAETVATKPAFRDAFRHRRCLLVGDSFSLAGRSIQMPDGSPFGVAAIWERWQQVGQNSVESCAIITTEANALLRPINARMPVIIRPDDYDRWLDCECQDQEELQRLLQAEPPEMMIV